MMRTHVDAIQPHAALRQQMGEMSVQIVHELLAEQPLRDPGLVGGNNQPQPRALQRAQRIDRLGKQRQPIDPIQIPDFFDERPVAIEKHRTAHDGTPADAPGAREIQVITCSNTVSGAMSRMQR
jgi:hypothetical protein